MLPFADKLYGDADFIFQQDLAPAHTAKGTKSWFNDHGVTVLDWPANSPDLNPIENLCQCQVEDETPDPKIQMTWRPLSKQPGLPLHLSSATGWLPPCHSALIHTGPFLANLTPKVKLWSNGIQASSDWQRSRPMILGIQWGGSQISEWPCHSLSQPCYNVVPVHVLIGAPSAGGALGHRLACLWLETVLDAVIHAKGGPTKYWVHRNEYTFRSLTFLFKISFFIDLMLYSETLNFGFSLSVSRNHQNFKK